MRIALALLLGLFLTLAGERVALAAPAERRVAFVVGNASYQRFPSLPNPRNDAEDVTVKLKQLGFEVFGGNDLNREGLRDQLRKFARAAQGAEAALAYYAGHGVQYKGRNYIVPIDAKLEDEFDFEYETVRVDDVVGELGRADGARILILDACRNLPLKEKSERNPFVNTGLAKIAGSGLVVAYATQANAVAWDGNGRNSIFTTAFLKVIDEPSLDLPQFFQRVSADVSRESKGKQTPELSLSYFEHFYLNRGETDVDLWRRIRTSDDPAVFQDFVQKYPTSDLAEVAKMRRDRLGGQQQQTKQAQIDRKDSDPTANWQDLKDQLARRKEVADENRRKEAEAKARTAEEKRLEAEQKARVVEENRRKEAEEKARTAEEKRLEAEAKAKLAEENRRKDAEEKARIADEKRLKEAEEKARVAEENRRKDADAKARIAEEKRLEAEAKARLVEENRRKDAEEKARVAEDNRRRKEAQESARIAEEDRRREEAQVAERNRLKESEEKARLAEEKRVKEAEEKARIAEENRRRKEAQENARVARLAEENRQKKEAEENARLAEEARLKDAADRARIAEEKRLREAEEKARIADEERLREAEKQARLAEKAQQRAAAEESARVARRAEAERQKEAARLVEANRLEAERSRIVEKAANASVPDGLQGMANQAGATTEQPKPVAYNDVKLPDAVSGARRPSNELGGERATNPGSEPEPSISKQPTSGYPVDLLTSDDLTLKTEGELGRIGCLEENADKVWDDRSRHALERYARRANLTPVPTDPDERLLERLKKEEQNFCPLECGPGTEPDGERCTPVPKPEPVAKRKPQPVQRAPKPEIAQPKREPVQRAPKPPPAVAKPKREPVQRAPKQEVAQPKREPAQRTPKPAVAQARREPAQRSAPPQAPVSTARASKPAAINNMGGIGF